MSFSKFNQYDNGQAFQLAMQLLESASTPATDDSWPNDSCPSIRIVGRDSDHDLLLWIDYHDQNLRDSQRNAEFCVSERTSRDQADWDFLTLEDAVAWAIVRSARIGDELEQAIVAIWRDADWNEQRIADLFGLPVRCIELIMDPPTPNE